MNALEKHGMTENTLIMVTSDNGCSPKAGFEHLAEQGHFPSYHFRGYKADIFEGGHRIPFIARWPGKIKPGTECGETICLTDLLATAAEMIDFELPDGAGEDSVSILPYFMGHEENSVREAVVHHSINGSFAIRKGKWKLELCPGSGGWSYPTPKEAKKLNLPPFQLYDLSKDKQEQDNLYHERPDVVSDLLSLLKEYVERGRSTPGLPQENVGKVKVIK
jgi:arylsulfatase A-like enzyme